jgi:hypothetical protein
VGDRAGSSPVSRILSDSRNPLLSKAPAIIFSKDIKEGTGVLESQVAIPYVCPFFDG